MTKRTWGLGLVVTASVGFWLAIVLTPGRAEDAAELYTQVAGARGRELAGAWLFVLAGAALLLGCALLLQRSVDRTATVGLLMLLVGSIWPVARGVTNAVAVAALDAHVGPARFDALLGSSAWAPLLVFLPVFLLAPVVLGVGLWRARRSSPLPTVLWLVGAVTYVATETSQAPAAAGFAVAAAGLCWSAAIAARAAARPAEPTVAGDVLATGPMHTG
ncbi:MAG: hypothetical protein ACXV3C_10055 [Actinomycetes bacterium]